MFVRFLLPLKESDNNLFYSRSFYYTLIAFMFQLNLNHKAFYNYVRLHEKDFLVGESFFNNAVIAGDLSINFVTYLLLFMPLILCYLDYYSGDINNFIGDIKKRIDEG